MGVAGSGKTTAGEALGARLGLRYSDADGFHPQSNVDKMHAGQPLTDDDRWPWLDRSATWLADLRGTGAIASCSALRRAYRDRLRARARRDLLAPGRAPARRAAADGGDGATTSCRRSLLQSQYARSSRCSPTSAASPSTSTSRSRRSSTSSSPGSTSTPFLETLAAAACRPAADAQLWRQHAEVAGLPSACCRQNSVASGPAADGGGSGGEALRQLGRRLPAVDDPTHRPSRRCRRPRRPPARRRSGRTRRVSGRPRGRRARPSRSRGPTARWSRRAAARARAPAAGARAARAAPARAHPSRATARSGRARSRPGRPPRWHRGPAARRRDAPPSTSASGRRS